MNHRSQHLGNRSFRSGHETHQAKHIEPIKWSVKELLLYQLSLVTHHFSLPQVPSRPHHLFFCHFSFSLLALRFPLVSFPTFPFFSFVSSFLLFPPYLSYFFCGKGEVNMASASFTAVRRCPHAVFPQLLPLVHKRVGGMQICARDPSLTQCQTRAP